MFVAALERHPIVMQRVAAWWYLHLARLGSERCGPVVHEKSGWPCPDSRPGGGCREIISMGNWHSGQPLVVDGSMLPIHVPGTRIWAA